MATDPRQQQGPQRGKPPAPSPNDSEAAPLLSRTPSSTTIVSTAPEKPWRLVISICILIISLADLGTIMASVSLVRIFEEISCAKYYHQHDPTKLLPDGGVPEAECKIKAVQELVALITGWQGVFNSIPGILLAVPLGALADRWGRKKVLGMSFVGILCANSWAAFICYIKAPLLWTWASAAFLMLGGGPILAFAILMTMVGDVASADTRTASFAWLYAAISGTEMLGPALASWLMRKNAFWPVWIGLCLQASVLLVMLALPETLQYRPTPPAVLNDDSEQDLADDHTTKPQHGLITRQYLSLKESVSFMFQNKNIALVILSFVFAGVGPGIMATLLYQYVSTRYCWLYADAVLLGTLRSAVNLVVYIFVLPALPILISRRFRVSIDQANMQICYFSSILLSAGLLVVAMSPSVVITVLGLVVYIFGTGYPSTIRSVGTTLIGGGESRDLAKLFTTMNMMQALGIIVIWPVVPIAFSWGLSLGGAWIGIPFLFVAALYGIMAIGTFLIRIPNEAVS